MPVSKRLIAISCITLVCAVPGLSYSQSLNDLLKLVPRNGSAGNILGAIQSLSEVTQGQVAPGTAPENVDGKVVLYRTAWCGYCRQAAAYMQRKNIGFVERDIETNSGHKAEFKRLGGKGVPLILFRDKTMSGFNEGTFDRHYAEFQRPAEGAAILAVAAPGAANSLAGNSAIQSGDVLVGKIGGVKVYNEPAKSSKSTALGKGDPVIYMGEERDGYYRVTTEKGEGWIEKLLVKKQ